jgi:hypothetical protein
MKAAGKKQKEAVTRVRLVAPGVLACGPYRAGQDYEVPSDEAARLVGRKGFVYTDQEG